MKTVINETFPVSAEGIDLLSERLSGILSGYSALTRRTVLKTRLTAEEILLAWMEESEKLTVQLVIEQRSSRLDIALTLKGLSYQVDPWSARDNLGDTQMYGNIMATLGTEWAIQFDHGINSAYLSLVIKKENRLLQTAVAIVSSLLLILLFRLLPNGVGSFANQYIITPLFGICSRLLTAMVSPMMFLSVTGGVLSVGNPKALTRLGRFVCKRFLFSTLLVILAAGVSAALLFGFDPVMGHLAGGTSLSEFLIQIVPDNIFSPFMDCNILQLVLLALFFGLAVLFLQRRVNVFRKLIDDANVIVCKILSVFDRFIPEFIFLSVLNLGLNEGPSLLSNFSVMLICFLGFMLTVMVMKFIIIKLRLRVPMKPLFQYLWATGVSGFLSSSSSAAFTESYDTCEKTFGVDSRLVGFALPIGTVIHKPMVAAEFLFFIYSACNHFGLTMNFSRLFLLLFITFIMSVAYPPISGGEITCYSLLLTQMGLPISFLAIASSASTILDFLEVPCNIIATEIEVLTLGKKMHMIDNSRLEVIRSSSRH